FNNVASSATSPVSVALQDNPGAGTLGGTTTVSASGGTASFNDLSVDRAGVGYTLTASAPSLALPRMGLSIEGVTGGEIAVLGYSWGETITPPPSGGGGGTSRPTLNDFQFTVDTSTADVGFLTSTAAGRAYPSLTLHVRNAAGQEYLTYELSDVLF